MRYEECRASDTRSVVVIGASAGGIEALRRIIPTLKPDFPAAVFIVQHLDPKFPSMLNDLLAKESSLPVRFAQDAMRFQPGAVYIAPPDYHILLEEGYVRLNHGPRINFSRPAVDPLFFSAAATYRACVVGIVLSGMLDDGAAGLAAIKRCGGVAIVQEPADASFANMPASAIAADHPDIIVSLENLTTAVTEAVYMPKEAERPVGDDIMREILYLKNPSDPAGFDDFGELKLLSCPECGGPVREKDLDGRPRYRCHVGHTFTGKWLLAAQDQTVEESLWVAVRTFRERAHIQRKLAETEERSNRTRSAARYRNLAQESEKHAQRLLELVTMKK